jgi:hypothetical protein
MHLPSRRDRGEGNRRLGRSLNSKGRKLLDSSIETSNNENCREVVDEIGRYLGEGFRAKPLAAPVTPR